jgi:ribonucleotide reductase alpha subunit
LNIEIESILVLGNNKGTTDNRVRQMDHAIVYNKLLLERQANNEDITLFYINDVPDLLYAMGNYEEFKKLYVN